MRRLLHHGGRNGKRVRGLLPELRHFATEETSRRSALPRLAGAVVVSGSLVVADAWFYSDAFGLRERIGASATLPPTPSSPSTSLVASAPVTRTDPKADAEIAAAAAKAEAERVKAAQEAAAAAEAAAKKAAAEAEAAAKEAAAAAEAAAACVEEAVTLVQNAMEQNFHEALLEPSALLAALQEAEVMVAKLSSDWQEKAQQSFVGARGRLKAAASVNNWRQAEAALNAQLAAEEDADLINFQAALEALQDAEVQLRNQGAEIELLGFKAELRCTAEKKLAALQATKAREEALQTLRSCLASRHEAQPAQPGNMQLHVEVQSALDAAKDAGVEGDLPAMRLAEALARPDVLCASLEEGPLSVGIVADDFATAAKAVAADCDSTQLEEQCARLAEMLAKTHEMQLENGRRTLQESLEKLRERTYTRAVKDFQNAHKLRNGALQRRKQHAAEASRAYVQEFATQARQRFAKERQARLEDLRQELGMALASINHEDAQETQKRLSTIKRPLETLEVARRETTSQGKLSLSAKLLSAAVEEKPAEALQALEESSGFVATLLKEVQQVEEAPLSVSEIRRSFGSMLQQLAAVALSPPSDGLLGRLVSGFLGRSLARLYELKFVAEEGATSDATETAQNLATLTRAAKCMEANDFSGAVTALEGLTGDCQRMASSWLQSTRRALLWQQTFEALQAKARCLNAA